MTIELGHFFILVDPCASQADLLTELGLIKGTPNEHPGKDAANRRFFLSRTAPELLYVRDEDEARNGPAR